MKICYSTNPFEDPLSEAKYAADNFGGVELSIDFPNALPQTLLERKRELSDILGSNDIALVAHMPCYANPAEVYPLVRLAHLNFLKESMECARKLGFEKIVFHAGFISGLGKKAKDVSKNIALESLAEIESIAQEHSLLACVENNPPVAGIFSAPEDISGLLKEFGFQFALDAGHMNLSGAPLKDMLKASGKKLAHVHLHDNFGDSDRHLPLGAGTFDYPQFVSQLKKSGYKDTVTLEVFSRDRDYVLLSKKKLESLL